jgi:hypothetical protein
MNDRLFSRKEIIAEGYKHIYSENKNRHYTDCYFFNPVTNRLRFYVKENSIRKYVLSEEFIDSDLFVSFVILKNENCFYLFGSWTAVEYKILEEKLKYIGIKEYSLKPKRISLKMGDEEVNSTVGCEGRLKFSNKGDEAAFLFYFDDRIKSISKKWEEIC